MGSEMCIRDSYSSFSNGRSPIWNQFGHERMGWALSVYNPATP